MKTQGTRVLIGVLVVMCHIILTQASAQYFQQGGKLISADAVGNAQQGVSVSLSADGNTAIIGGFTDNGGAGAAWIYTRSGGVWTQQGGKLVGTGAVGAAEQGLSVAISADGMTAVVGGWMDNGGSGAAWVYTLDAGVWTQEGGKLVGTGAGGGAHQGFSVDISAVGNTVIVGGLTDYSDVGAAWVFTRNGGVWTQQGNKLVGSGAVGPSGQGFSVAISADGNTAIVGGSTDNGTVRPDYGNGAAWIFTRSGGIWTQQGAKLVGTSGSGSNQRQGIAVSLSDDGNTAMVGGYTDGGQIGAAWVYTRNGGGWTQQGGKLVGTGSTGAARQGVSVSLDADGNTAVVGGYYDNSLIGAAWVFTRSSGVWTQQGGKLIGTGASGGSLQGRLLSISADGNTIMVGGYGDDNYKGATWVYIKGSDSSGMRITAITDIPRDQGGAVRIEWNRSWADDPVQSPQVSSYSIFRKSSSGGSNILGLFVSNVTMDSSLLGYDYVSSVPALQLPRYQTVVPTLEDSTATGAHYFNFLIVALTTDLNTYYVSPVDSGYSVDNIAPIPPTGLSAGVGPGPVVELFWNSPIDTDVKLYDIYRSTTSGFTPVPGDKIGESRATGFVDGAPITGMASYYKIIAVDVHDNRSTPSDEVTVNLTGLDDEGALPVAFALSQNYPNPFNPTTSISYALPSSEYVVLTVFNMLGQEVAMLVDEIQGAGYHTVSLDASHLPSGMYTYRMTAGTFTDGKKMLILK